ncbi:amino acid ABC transporter ATP-binding protein [Pseudorhodoplanes sp.]|uniref:amino acid ABC transporter ATP-binding protein n=1 Tax=Pseudorhodoplanes sp. TaxID=1934341 RepID=UPI003D0E675D
MLSENNAVMKEPIIEFRKVFKFFGSVKVLDDVSFSVRPGEVIVVCGPSGSGKSTMIRCANALETIQAGEIFIDGRPVGSRRNDLSSLRREVGMVFQQFNLYPHLSVLKNITLAPTKVRKLGLAEANARARQLLERVGIADKEAAYPDQLSGGQRQRVAIARALAMQPKIMLFDEPTSALDPEMITEVLDTMAALAEDGMTMIVVTHEMAFARRIADRILFMDAGRMIVDSPPGEFFDSASDDRVKKFLAKILR